MSSTRPVRQAGSSYYVRGQRFAGLRIFAHSWATDAPLPAVTLYDPFFGHPSEDTLAKAVLDLPTECLDVDLLVFRGVEEEHDYERLRELLKRRTKRELPFSWLEFPATLDAFHPGELRLFSPNSDPTPPALLTALRDLEFTAQLQWSGAIQASNGAHFELPAGTHASHFIRVSDAFTDITVIRRLADWVRSELTDNCVVAGDTWTILPLLQELAYSTLTWKRPSRTEIITFPAYPSLSSFEQALLSIPPLLSDAAVGKVVFILSVVSSKQLYDRLVVLAAQLLGRGVEFRIVPLVDARPEGDSLGAFTRISGVRRYDVPNGEACQLCLATVDRPIVKIDHRRYAPVIRGTLKKHMLVGDAALAHRGFWEVASKTEAVYLHADDTSTGKLRHLPISLRVDKLLQDRGFRRSVISELRRQCSVCDLVIIPQHHATEQLADLARTAYENPRIMVMPRPSLSPDGGEQEVIDKARELLGSELPTAQHILILDDVAINGSSIRALHRLVQNLLTHCEPGPDGPHEVHAFVVIGRPSSRSRWKRLQDSLRQGGIGVHLGCAKLLFMSDDNTKCPWCAERSVWQEIGRRIQLTARERPGRKVSPEMRRVLDWINSRIDHLSPEAPVAYLQDGIFLCRADGTTVISGPEHLSPHSLFGEGLSESAAFAAVASALHELRIDFSREPGTAHVWDVPRILTAYHDPLLSASFLRAAYTEEIVITDYDSEFEDALAEISFASSHSAFRQSAQLAAELEWALVTQKFPATFDARVHTRIAAILAQAGGPLTGMLHAARKHLLGSDLTLVEEGASES